MGQAVCWESYPNSESFMCLHDMLPSETRALLRDSKYNICSACYYDKWKMNENAYLKVSDKELLEQFEARIEKGISPYEDKRTS